MKGWGPKSSIRPSKPGKSNFFCRDIPGLCRDIPGAPEKFENKKFGFNFRSLKVAKNPVEKFASNPVTSVAVMVFSALNELFLCEFST